MVTIQIGTETRGLGDASPSWINEQISRRRSDSLTVCVQVRVQEPGLDLILRTPTCGGMGGGGGRAPNERERMAFELWDRLHLNEASFTGGNVTAFLQQLENL